MASLEVRKKKRKEKKKLYLDSLLLLHVMLVNIKWVTELQTHVSGLLV
jgi:hypothetical protein